VQNYRQGSLRWQSGSHSIFQIRSAVTSPSPKLTAHEPTPEIGTSIVTDALEHNFYKQFV